MDTVTLPGFAAHARDPTQITDARVVATGMMWINLGSVAQAARGEDAGAGALPLDKRAQVRDGERQRLVNEHGNARLDKRARAADVIKAVIRGDEDRVHAIDDVLGFATISGINDAVATPAASSGLSVQR